MRTLRPATTTRTRRDQAAAAEPPTLAFAASVVALGFLGSRLLGLLRTVVIADQHGTSPDIDAYFVAFRMPDLIFQLLAGATLGSAFIPTFARVVAGADERAGWRLASNVLNLVFVATLLAAFAGLLLAPLLVPATAPGLGEEIGREEELQSLAVDLTRIMMVSPVLFAVSGMFMGILNARHHFLAPALAPMFYNAAIIAGALVSDSVRVLALAVVAGAALHLVVQLPALRLVGMRWQPLFDWRDAAVREVARLMGPRVVGLAAFHLNFVIATFFASTLESGAIAAVNYAWLIVMTPLGLFGMAIATAAFPRMAEEAARDTAELRDMLSRSLRMILFLTIPASVGIVILARPITAFLLRSGAFDATSMDLVVAALALYAIGLFAHAGIEILSRGFYALSDTRTPVAFAVISMVVNLVLSLLLVWPFGVGGLATALSAAAIVEFVLLVRTLARRLRGLDGARVAASVARTCVAALLMAEVVLVWLAVLKLAGLLDLSRKPEAGLAVVGGVCLGAAAFFIASLALRNAEARTLVERLPLPAGLRRLAPAAGRTGT
ncbi:MAG TPA: murein biosynthesis integral membrane protein MurJ [Vicinamibacterales bacterium]|nr:murein biosynthesis integral membrane protein MurJ [Vicinamibacterales bacterium]